MSALFCLACRQTIERIDGVYLGEPYHKVGQVLCGPVGRLPE